MKPAPTPAFLAQQVQGTVSADLPLVFLDPDADSGLSEEDLARWKTLRVDFLRAILGMNRNPNDPQYQHHWENAKTKADGQLKELIGEKMYLQLRKKQAELQVGVKGEPH